MKRFNKLIDNFAGLCFLIVLVVILVQIFFRFVLKIGVPWTEEISRLFFIYLIFIGAAVAVRKGEMIVVDTIPNLVKGRLGLFLKLIINVFSFLFILIMFYAAMTLTEKVWSTTLSTVDWISNGWIYMAQVIGFGLMIIYMIKPLIRNVIHLVKGGE